ncbi:MAG: S9 family peptidase [Nevskiaceae bacterium]|nr:MAG: S9 family peptidase [Nevskiaceae bacterium]
MLRICLLSALAVIAACGKKEAPPAASAPAVAPAVALTPPALIPRAELFGNPDKALPKLSPDGKQLSWLAPVNGVLNVWLAPADDPKAAKPVTQDSGRGIRQYWWAYDNQRLLYLQDAGGDENFHVYAVELATLKTTDLTPYKNTRAEINGISHKIPGEILVGLNDRGDHSLHDLYRIDIASGKRKLVEKNPGFAGYVSDDDYAVKLAVRSEPDGSMVYLQRDAKGQWQPLVSVGLEDAITTNVLGLDAKGETIYLLDSRGRDTAALATLGLKDSAPKIVFEDARADVDNVLINPVSHVLEAVASNYEKPSWTVLDAAVKADFAALGQLAGDGHFEVLDRTLDDSRWVVGVDRSDASYKTYVYDRASRKAEFLFANRPWFEGKSLAKMHPRVLKARDGLKLVSYLSLPVESDPDGDGVPNQPLPLVLNVHGGPWARDGWGLDNEHQWLANRGYAVLSVNYRGSTGFGKNFVNASNLEWAGKMHEDLLDAVQWAIDSKITSADKVAIYGGSYGGYATLVGLTFTPDTFACGVDIVGPSNLNTLLSTIPPYWKTFFEQFARRVGDPRTEEGKKLLAERSPLSRVEQIKKPLLIAQGANDPRVKQAEAEQIVAAMQAKQIPVTYVLYPDEGHGFARPPNRQSFYAISEAFLGKCLGGRAEAVGKDFENSSLQVKVGAEFVPGLSEALSPAASAAQ